MTQPDSPQRRSVVPPSVVESRRPTLLTFSGRESVASGTFPIYPKEEPLPQDPPLRRLLRLVQDERKLMLQGSLLQTGQALTHIPFVAGVGLFIDHILPTNNLSWVAVYVAANLVLLPIHGWFTVQAFWVSERVVRRTVAKLQSELVAQLQRLRLSFFAERGAGRLSNQLTVDLERLQRFLDHAANAFVVNAVVGAGTLLYLFLLNWRLALVSLLAAPVQLLLIRWFGKSSDQLSHRAQRAGEGFSARVVEFVFGIRVVKTFGNEQLAANKLQRKIRNLERERVDAAVALRKLLMKSHMVSMAVPVAVWGLGAYLHFQQEVTVGELVAFVGLLGFVQNGFSAFSQTYEQWINARPGLTSILSLLDHQDKEDTWEDDLVDVGGTIELSHVHFRYEEQREALFDDFSLKIPAGQHVGLVGASGAGKSTFVDLILGFIDAQQGTVTIDGHAMDPRLKASLRQKAAMMSQDSFLWNTTIMENIRFGRPGASDDECRAAAEQARVSDFVDTLPDGYQSLCGERGSRLSGGQRQRVALARLFLRSPQIVVLDEPTSALDVETEARLLRDLEAFVNGRTTFVVAHRLSTLRLCDRVLVFSQGRVVEDGHPRDLRRDPSSHFFRLWEMQSGMV